MVKVPEGSGYLPKTPDQQTKFLAIQFSRCFRLRYRAGDRIPGPHDSQGSYPPHPAPRNWLPHERQPITLHCIVRFKGPKHNFNKFVQEAPNFQSRLHRLTEVKIDWPNTKNCVKESKYIYFFIINDLNKNYLQHIQKSMKYRSCPPTD